MSQKNQQQQQMHQEKQSDSDPNSAMNKDTSHELASRGLDKGGYELRCDLDISLCLSLWCDL